MNDLIDKVIEQIKDDFEIGDYTAIVELLMAVPRTNLIAYLPEEEVEQCQRPRGNKASVHGTSA